MIAVEEKCFKSVKTDASLYNGQPTKNRVKKPSSLGLCRGAKKEGNSQPTDTGTMYHSVGVTSSTLSIPKDKDGVSVKNVHTHSKQWFVPRVSYDRVLKAKEIIDARNIDAVKSDKLAYIYNTPIFNKKGVDFDSFEKHLPYILMFAREYPDSGSVKTMLSDIDKRIEDWLNPKEEQEGKESKKPNYIPGGSIRAMSAICTQIGLENVGCSHYAFRVISRMIDSLKDMKEKQSIIDLVYHKLCNQPNSDYNQLWLQNMTYTQDKKAGISPYSLRLCQLVAGKQILPLWNNDWIKTVFVQNMPIDSIVDKETLKKVTPVITFRETRAYNEVT